MKKMIRIGIDGTVTELENTGLESIYAAIGNGCGTIDCFRLQDAKGHVLYIDDEGLMKPNVLNDAATHIARLCLAKAGGGKESDGRIGLVGNAVLVGTYGSEDCDPDPDFVNKIVMPVCTVMELNLSEQAEALGWKSVKQMLDKEMFQLSNKW
jgi:hypothetical protein